MIVAVAGAVCSGKASFALYLEKEYNFRIVNLYSHFAEIQGLKD